MFGKLPTGKFRQIVQSRSHPYTVTRYTESTGDIGETVSTEEQHTVNLYLYTPTSRPVKKTTGEVLEGGMLGMCLHEEDVQVKDTLVYDGIEYEVSETTDIPSGTDSVVTKFVLTRV